MRRASTARVEKQNPDRGRGAKPHAALIRRGLAARCQTEATCLQAPSTVRAQRTETQPTSRVRLFAMLTTPSEPILEQTRLRGASALGSAGMHGAFGREAQFRGKSTSQPKLRRRNRPKVQAGFALPYASRKAKPRPLGPGRKTSCCIDTSFIGGLLSNGGGLFARSVNIVLGS